MSTQLITIKVNEKFLADLRNQTLVNGAGQFHIGEDGTARVPIEVASECYTHPAYEIPNETEKTLVQKFLTNSVVTESGNYDAGKPVRVECKDYCGVGTAAPDGITVRFSPEGFAVCGIKTAQALQKIVPSLQIHALDNDEKAKISESATNETSGDKNDESTSDDDTAETTEDVTGDGDSKSTPTADEEAAKKKAEAAKKAAATRAKNAAAKKAAGA